MGPGFHRYDEWMDNFKAVKINLQGHWDFISNIYVWFKYKYVI